VGKYAKNGPNKQGENGAGPHADVLGGGGVITAFDRHGAGNQRRVRVGEAGSKNPGRLDS